MLSSAGPSNGFYHSTFPSVRSSTLVHTTIRSPTTVIENIDSVGILMDTQLKFHQQTSKVVQTESVQSLIISLLSILPPTRYQFYIVK